MTSTRSTSLRFCRLLLEHFLGFPVDPEAYMACMCDLHAQQLAYMCRRLKGGPRAPPTIPANFTLLLMIMTDHECNR